MNQKPAPAGAGLSRNRGASRSFSVILLAVFIGALALGLWAWKSNRAVPTEVPLNENASADVTEMVPDASTPPDEELRVAIEEPTTIEAGPATVQVRAVTDSAATAQELSARISPPSEAGRQLINELCDLSGANLPQTRDQAAAWKQKLAELVQQGPDSIGAIQEFLNKNLDFAYGTEASALLGHSSARAAMFDALAQIGGPEATGLLLQVLQTTGDPREIALLGLNLDRIDPGRYQTEAVDAARQILAMAKTSPTPDLDVGPLFEVMQKYGGAGAIADLEQASSRWNQYSAVALGQLPEGAGVPSLIGMVEQANGKAKSMIALEVLAQVSTQYPQARAALLSLVRENKVPPSSWPYLASGLIGDQIHVRDSVFNPMPQAARSLKTFHVVSGNQNLYSVPYSLAPEYVNLQLGLVDELLQMVSDPKALQSLQHSKDVLTRRLAPPNIAIRSAGGS